MIQCRRCNEWGHFARDYQNGGGSKLCRWCGLGKRKDVECPKRKVVNMPEVKETKEQVMVVTHLQTKKASYPNPQIEKERLK